ncbi:MAG: hypothetical protein GY940_37770, partial [bacterium]|nr:hypothetical protein [bacterium]
RLFNNPVATGLPMAGRILLKESITYTQTLRLSYRDNIISFRFAALNFRLPEKNRYAYMMEGFEKEWNYSGRQRSAGYINLPPGKYTFRVKGSNNDGLWNEEGTSIRLIITPPIWKTWWFRITFLVLVVGLVYLFFRLKTRSLENRRKELERTVELRTREVRKQREIAEKERRIAETANQAKSQFLARMSHEIRTPMNSVVGFADMLLDAGLKGETREFADNIHRGSQTLLELIDHILDFSMIETGKMNLESKDFEPAKLIEDVCESMTAKLADKPVD